MLKWIIWLSIVFKFIYFYICIQGLLCFQLLAIPSNKGFINHLCFQHDDFKEQISRITPIITLRRHAGVFSYLKLIQIAIITIQDYKISTFLLIIF